MEAVRAAQCAKVPEVELLELEREAAKLCWAGGAHSEALLLLTGSMRMSLSAEACDPLLRGLKSELNAKSVLSLVKWLQSEAQRDLVEEMCVRHAESWPLDDSSPLTAVANNMAFLTEQEFIDGMPLAWQSSNGAGDSALGSHTSGGAAAGSSANDVCG